VGSQRHIVLDGAGGPDFDSIGVLAFNHDGSHLAYWAQKADKQLVMIDRAAGPAFFGIVLGPVDRKDSNLEYLAAQQVSGNLELNRVIVTGFDSSR
jgi:hypothetical protein